MIIHAFVEGPSERVLFETWMPRLLRNSSVRVHQHQGKGSLPDNLSKPPDPKHRGLLDQLPAKLAAFESSRKKNELVLVFLDADDEDPDELMQKIVRVAERVSPNVRVLVSAAVEETEAFYLGDLRALKRAYPNADMELARKYEPDSICNTWEYFGQVVGDDGGNKVAWAEEMGAYLATRVADSRSPSFKRLCTALARLDAEVEPGKKRRKFFHKAKSKKSRR